MDANILFDARLALERPTGIGRYIASLVPELVRLAPQISFHLLRRAEPWPDYRLESLSAPNLTHHVTDLPHMALRQQLALPRLARDLGVDLLHYPHFDAPVGARDVPVVATIHDAKELRGGQESNLPLHKRLAVRLLTERTLRGAAAVIAVSRATAQALDAIVSGSSQRITVVYEAADPDFGPASGSAVDALRSSRSLERPFVLSVSERRPHKNIDGLVRAYARSRTKTTHDLVIVGRPWRNYRGPERTVEELGLDGAVRILGDVAHDELVALYTAADVFVLVSFHEGFGLPLLEAMACGTPVVASRTSAAGEITGEAGVTVDPSDPVSVADGMDRVVHDRRLHDSLAERGRVREAEFTWERAASETLDVYRAVLESRRARLRA